MKKHKLINALLIIWGFINCIVFIVGYSHRKSMFTIVSGQEIENGEVFFTYYNATDKFHFFLGSDIEYYDLTEFLIYVGLPILIYYLYRYVKGRK